MKRNEV